MEPFLGIRGALQDPNDQDKILFDLLGYHWEFDFMTQLGEFKDIAYRANYLYQIGLGYFGDIAKETITLINQYADICEITPFEITQNPPFFLSWESFDDITSVLYTIGFFKQKLYPHDIHASLIPKMELKEYFESMENMRKK